MKETRRKTKGFIYSIGAAIIALILIRFVLKILGASPSNTFIDIFYQISFIFVSPFQGIANDIQNGIVIVEFTSIISIVLWLAIILIIAEFITSFMYDEARDIILNLVDAFFKFLEFFLIARLFMRAFGVNLGVNGFVDVIYSIAGIVYTPFQGIAPGITVPTGVIEISTLIALIIVIVFDIVTDGLLKSVLPDPKEDQKEQVTSQVNVFVGNQSSTDSIPSANSVQNGAQVTSNSSTHSGWTPRSTNN